MLYSPLAFAQAWRHHCIRAHTLLQIAAVLQTKCHGKPAQHSKPGDQQMGFNVNAVSNAVYR